MSTHDTSGTGNLGNRLALHAQRGDKGADLGRRYREEIAELQELGLLEWSGPRLRLTKPTYLIANQVFTRFLG